MPSEPAGYRPAGLMAPTSGGGSFSMDKARNRSEPKRRQIADGLMRLACVFVGGAVGTLCRYGIDLSLAKGSAFPLATFGVDTSGSFGLGLVSVLLNERLPPTRFARPLVSIGFFGAYTTFSTMAVEGVKLIDAGRAGL